MKSGDVILISSEYREGFAIGEKISGLDVTSLTHEKRDSFANALDNLK
jgi:hypothetical protein